FALIFCYYLFVEFILAITGLGVDSTEEDEYLHEDPKNPRWLDHYGVAISGLLLVTLIPSVFIHIATSSLSFFEIAGTVLSLVFVSGTVGGLVGHEYIHRQSKWEQTLGYMVYGCFNYAHFSVSHVYGHHRFIGLEHDWSTSRKGESSYAFFARAIWTGYIGAWKLNAENRKRKKQKFWSFSNFMLMWTAVQLAVLTTSLILLGLTATLKLLSIYLIYSLFSVCLSEMVNYVSHYGLKRETTEGGRLESVDHHHSWESANKVTNWFIFNAGKHAEHHCKAMRPHFELKLGQKTEKLPQGLLLLTVIALIPPLYFRIMDPMLERRQAQLAAKALGELCG
ncbi:MAG: alkane 1-monooxygenase, partial [Pseudobdellovibrio sp.]